jgi:acid stress-induced BolA-like protein IbaG/YrbA
MGAGGDPTKRRAKQETKEILFKVLKDIFPDDTVDISDGYGDNIHVLVVSRRFDGLQDEAKLDMIWDPINKSVLTEDEKSLISLALPLSPAEIK